MALHVAIRNSCGEKNAKAVHLIFFYFIHCGSCFSNSDMQFNSIFTLKEY